MPDEVKVQRSLNDFKLLLKLLSKKYPFVILPIIKK